MITYLFYGLFFLTPLILFPQSSELFELNKMVFVYASTVLVVTAWIIKSIYTKKFVFRRTILDIPILLFLLSLLVSTFFSIDVRTSLLGYYSRFHGGLTSYLSYSLLYWAYVSNMDTKKTLKSIYCLLGSAVLVSAYGVLQHFGIDKDIWVQDVQNRIFSTLGQPNWLAAWIVALIPITWALLIPKGPFRLLWYTLSGLFFVVLLFTKSRSGLLGFLTAEALFWGIALWQEKRKVLKPLLIHNFLYLILILAIGTPWSPNLAQIISPIQEENPNIAWGTQIETGGTESGEIRKIVWKGAVELWKKYPLLGTGPETFGYSYYETRPIEHNLVSEWDFLYNKAHNEYLNFASTTGTLGLASYLLLVAAMVLMFSRNLQKGQGLDIGLTAGWASILVSNFFGFSVVPVALLFFMFPAVNLQNSKEKVINLENLKKNQKAIIILVSGLSLYLLFLIGRYWYSDFLYAKARFYFSSEDYNIAREYVVKAVTISPNEPLYWSKLAETTAALAQNDPEISEVAVSEINKAMELSPRNLNIQRSAASVFVRLGQVEPSYLAIAKRITENAALYAPTDAKLYYDLGLTTYRLGQTEEALDIFEKTIRLKSNYKNARFAKALILMSQGKNEEAKIELNYILEKIDPNDNLVKEELAKLQK